jgi:hypothetical protein
MSPELERAMWVSLLTPIGIALWQSVAANIAAKKSATDSGRRPGRLHKLAYIAGKWLGAGIKRRRQ